MRDIALSQNKGGILSFIFGHLVYRPRNHYSDLLGFSPGALGAQGTLDRTRPVGIDCMDWDR